MQYAAIYTLRFDRNAESRARWPQGSWPELWDEVKVGFDAAKGVYRWVRSGNIPFPDVYVSHGFDKLPGFDLATQERVKREEDEAHIAAYRKDWRPPSGEQLAEMRGEFGEGTVMVDAVSGKRFTL